MKNLLIIIGLFGSLSSFAETDMTETETTPSAEMTASSVSPTESPVDMASTLLLQMNKASKSLNYELSYVHIRQNNVDPLVYRHSVDDGFVIAHSLYLTGQLREVIRLDDVITYIEPGIEPFSIRSNNMVAPIIPLLNVDIDHLSTMYDFISIGRSREVGLPCQVVRIVPKDGLRYSYVVWIDENTKLPLRADLVDRSGEVLEQYRTVSFAVDERILPAMRSLRNVKLPEVLSLPNLKEQQTDWQVKWIPEGFVDSGVNRYRVPATDTLVENRLFTDGLFEFSIYVTDKSSTNNTKQNDSAEMYRQGRRVIHTFSVGNKEISVIGDIPPVTAKRIIESVTFAPKDENQS